MRIQNISRSMIRVAGLSIAPGRTGTVNDNHWNGWLMSTHHQRLAGERLRVVPDEPEEMQVNRETRIYLALGHLNKENPDAWLRSGYPDLNNLRNVTGLYDLTGNERDAAWERYINEHPEENNPQE